VALRQILDLYVCLRPVRWFQGVPSPVKSPDKVDMVIFRENTEDIYAGIEFQAGSPEAAKVLAFLEQEFPASYKKVRFPGTSGIGFKPVSQEGSERLIRAAIEYALVQQASQRHDRAQGQHHEVHRGRVPQLGLRARRARVRDRVYTWEQWERTKAAKGEDAANAEQKAALGAGRVLIKDAIADITLQQVLTRPDEFDVIATLNLNGDYLSRRARRAGRRHRYRARRQHQLRHGPRGVRGHARHGAQVREPRSRSTRARSSCPAR
jgi:isocitrate dehydrogenase